MERYRLPILLIACLLPFVGCRQYASVHGTVSGGGKAVDGGNIILRPSAEGVKPAAGEIQPDGTFELKTAGDEGITPGSYSVLFTAPLPDESDESLGPASPWKAWKAPSESVTIEPGENNLAIELIKNH